MAAAAAAAAALPVGDVLALAAADPLALVRTYADPTVTAVRTTSLAGAGGYSGTLTLLTCARPGGAPDLELVLKTHTPQAGGHADDGGLGLAREALFYADASLGPAVACAPRAFVAAGDMATGAKAVLLARAPGTQAGYFFGRGSPHNDRPDLPELAAREGAPTADDVTRAAFAAAAAVHARFWRDPRLLRKAFLRGSDWRQGHGEDGWRAAQRVAADAWARARGGAAAAAVAAWDPRLVALVDASLAAVDWAAYQAAQARAPWTLVHGDFHPANMMYAAGGRLALLDWEVVGLGDPAQELGQFVISHMAPAQRRAGERARIDAYHAALTAARPAIAAEYSAADAWEGYVRGGVARWCWLLPILTGLCPPAALQHFADQVLAFAVDHGVTADNAPMARV